MPDNAEIDRVLDIGKRLAECVPVHPQLPTTRDLLERTYHSVMFHFLDQAKHRMLALFDLCQGNPIRHEEGAIVARSLFEIAVHVVYLEKHWKDKLALFLEFGKWAQYQWARKLGTDRGAARAALDTERESNLRRLEKKFGGKNKTERGKRKPKWPDLCSLCRHADDDERTLHRAYAAFYPLTSAAAHSGAACFLYSLRVEGSGEGMEVSRANPVWWDALADILHLAVSFFIEVVKGTNRVLCLDMEEHIRRADAAFQAHVCGTDHQET